MSVTTHDAMQCDGCGQMASPEHVARRLQRLEWTTRYRPIHIGTLLLGAVAPEADSDFLYAPGTEFNGESRSVLQAAGVGIDGKSAEEVLTEFQRGGLLLAYVVECPVERSSDAAAASKLLEQRLSFVAARIRRSLKPKRVAPISALLDPLVSRLESASLGCPLLLDGGKAFTLEVASSGAVARLREAFGFAATVK